jgi:3-oxoacyl-[acyl-carrier-protein] synthase II
VITSLAIHHGVVPPTINLDRPDPECGGIDLVPHEARKRDVRAAMNNSFGFGGTNVTLIFGRAD